MKCAWVHGAGPAQCCPDCVTLHPSSLGYEGSTSTSCWDRHPLQQLCCDWLLPRRAISARPELESKVRELATSLAEDMAREALRGRTLTLKLKLTSFEVGNAAGEALGLRVAPASCSAGG